MRHLARIWKFYLYPPMPSVRLGLDLQGGSHVVLRARNQAVLTYSFGEKLAATEEAEGELQARLRELLIEAGVAGLTVSVSGREITVRAEAATRDDVDPLMARVTNVIVRQSVPSPSKFTAVQAE